MNSNQILLPTLSQETVTILAFKVYFHARLGGYNAQDLAKSNWRHYRQHARAYAYDIIDHMCRQNNHEREKRINYLQQLVDQAYFRKVEPLDYADHKQIFISLMHPQKLGIEFQERLKDDKRYMYPSALKYGNFTLKGLLKTTGDITTNVVRFMHNGTLKEDQQKTQVINADELVLLQRMLSYIYGIKYRIHPILLDDDDLAYCILYDLYSTDTELDRKDGIYIIYDKQTSIDVLNQEFKKFIDLHKDAIGKHAFSMLIRLLEVT